MCVCVCGVCERETQRATELHFNKIRIQIRNDVWRIQTFLHDIPEFKEKKNRHFNTYLYIETINKMFVLRKFMIKPHILSIFCPPEYFPGVAAWR